MNSKNFNVPLTVIMVEDEIYGGYTAHFKQLPNIIAEGKNEDKAMQNLMNAVHDVFKYENTITNSNYGNSKVIEKSVNLQF